LFQVDDSHTLIDHHFVSADLRFECAFVAVFHDDYFVVLVFVNIVAFDRVDGVTPLHDLAFFFGDADDHFHVF
jgi:hypothetical protein